MRFTLVLIVLLTTFAYAQKSSPKDKEFVPNVLATARSYVEAKDFNTAVVTLTSALTAQAQDSENPSESTPLLAKLAEVYGLTKDWSDQEKTFDKLITIWTNIAGPNSAIVVHYLLAQAAAFRNNGDSANADATERKAMPVLNQLYGFGNPAIMAVLHRCPGCFKEYNDELWAAATSHGPAVNPPDPTKPIKIAPIPDLRNLSKSDIGVQLPPKLTSHVEPGYAEEARKARLEGTVVLKIAVGEQGTVQQVWIINPLGLGLDEEAIKAVKQWRFEPGTKDGKPVPTFANIEVNFHIY
jgi:TonB family protein